MKRITLLLMAVILACAMTCPALAAEAPEGTAPVRPAALYPTEIVETETGSGRRLEKVYLLTAADNPANIPTADFEREGYRYTLLDVTRQDYTESETREHTETVTLDSGTKDMDKIMPQLAATREVTTEDGFTGILTLDTASIAVEAAGYGSSSRTVTATRSYPNLSDADTSLIPRTIQDGGRTLTLADVQWQEAGGFYNATATYSGTASSKYATGYIATVEYKGEVSRTSCDTVLYTATFASHGETHFENTPQPTQAPAATDAPADTDSAGVNWAILVSPAALLLGLAGFGGWKLVNYIKDKKRGYVK